MYYTFKNFKSFMFVEILTIVISCLLFKYNNVNITDMQRLKSEVSYIYVFTSLIGTFFFIYLKDRFKFDHELLKPIRFIGKNALYLYFAQGLSSSLMYGVVRRLTINNIYVKLLAMFFIHLATALIIFIGLMFIYKLVDIVIEKIKAIKFLKISNILQKI